MEKILAQITKAAKKLLKHEIRKRTFRFASENAMVQGVLKNVT